MHLYVLGCSCSLSSVGVSSDCSWNPDRLWWKGKRDARLDSDFSTSRAAGHVPTEISEVAPTTPKTPAILSKKCAKLTE